MSRVTEARQGYAADLFLSSPAGEVNPIISNRRRWSTCWPRVPPSRARAVAGDRESPTTRDLPVPSSSLTRNTPSAFVRRRETIRGVYILEVIHRDSATRRGAPRRVSGYTRSTVESIPPDTFRVFSRAGDFPPSTIW